MFKLLQKIIGVKQLSVIAKVDIKEISDICYSDKFGFFFISNQCLGLINKSGKLEYPILGNEGEAGDNIGEEEFSLLNNPTSIIFRESTGEIFIIEKYGKTIRTINTREDYSSKRYLSDASQKTIDKIFVRECIEGKTAIGLDAHTISWTNSLLNMVFILKYNGDIRIIGGEKEGYSISNSDEKYMFNRPSGIAISNNNIYISDMNNHCVRRFGINNQKNIANHIVAGHPLKLDISPKKLLVINDNLLFISNNSVKSYISGNKTYNDIYISDNIVSITNGPQNRLTILEKENA